MLYYKPKACYAFVLFTYIDRSNSISSRLGVPATIDFDNTILEAVTVPEVVPAIIYHHLKITHIMARISKLLGQNIKSSSGLQRDVIPNIRVFDEELDLLLAQHASSWEPETKIMLISVQLKLYSFAFLHEVDKLPHESQVMHDSFAEVCVSAYKAVMELVVIANSRSKYATFWPAHIWSCLIYAAMFLLRLGEYSQIYKFEEARIRSALATLKVLFAEQSTRNDDHMSRVCAVIEYLSKESWTDIRRRRPVKFQSRMASNLPLDTVWHAKERFNMGRQDQLSNNDVPMLEMENWMLPFWDDTSYPLDALDFGI